MLTKSDASDNLAAEIDAALARMADDYNVYLACARRDRAVRQEAEARRLRAIRIIGDYLDSQRAIPAAARKGAPK